jgi:synaptobrevin family protein YKT6
VVVTTVIVTGDNGNDGGGGDAVAVAAAVDFPQFGFFQRSSVREMLVFISRTLIARIDVGIRVVDHEGYQCFCYRQEDGLCAIAVCDRDYPSRVAFTMLRSLVERFAREHARTWRAVEDDNACRFPELEAALAEYQTPEKVDTIMKIQSSLAETKEVLVRALVARALCTCTSSVRCLHRSSRVAFSSWGCIAAPKHRGGSRARCEAGRLGGQVRRPLVAVKAVLHASQGVYACPHACR